MFFKVHLDALAAQVELHCDPREVSQTCWIDGEDLSKVFAKQTGQVEGKSSDNANVAIEFEEMWPYYAMATRKGMGYAAVKCIERIMVN